MMDELPEAKGISADLKLKGLSRMLGGATRRQLDTRIAPSNEIHRRIWPFEA